MSDLRIRLRFVKFTKLLFGVVWNSSAKEYNRLLTIELFIKRKNNKIGNEGVLS